MNKKVVFIIIIIVLILAIVGVYNFSSKQEENQATNNIGNESDLENNQEDLNNEEEQQIENAVVSNENNSISNTMNVNQNSNSANNSINTDTNINTNNNTSKTVATQVSPSGFMGSSLYRVILYSNGEVYVQRFDGNGYEQENIVSEDLIAKNVNSIEVATDDEHYGEVIVYGGEVVNNNIGWIEFEQ